MEVAALWNRPNKQAKRGPVLEARGSRARSVRRPAAELAQSFDKDPAEVLTRK